MSYIDGNSIAHWSSDPSSPDAIEANQDSDPNAPTTMNQTDELKRENDALRDRLGKLCEACLRVSEGLDVSAVLREITENARALTNARYGVITVRDDAGRTPEVVSSGFTADEHQELQDSPGRWKLDDYLRDVPAPLRRRVGEVVTEPLPPQTRACGLPHSVPLMAVSLKPRRCSA